MPAQFRIYIVRHGETDWNKSRRIQGQADVPLNETGLQQASLVADALKHIPFGRAFSSDLKRASMTAECILQHHPDVVLERDELIRERYMGELQGEIARSNKSAPSVETMPYFVARSLAWYTRSIVSYMDSVLRTNSTMEQPHNILLVSHAAWITALLSVLQENRLMARRKGVHIGRCLNTGVSIIEYTMAPGRRNDVLRGILVQFSDIDHLIHKNLHVQEANADILEDRGRNH